MTLASEPPKRPSRSKKDTAHMLAKAALSAVPVAGGPLAELFAYLVAEPAQKRRDEWIEQIAQRVDDLHKSHGTKFIEQLRDKPEFTTIVLQATHTAMRNHQQEKLEALANAVVNTALGMTPDETERAIMVELIDRLTPTHVALLRLFAAPLANSSVEQRAKSISAGSLTEIIEAAFPDLRRKNDLVSIIWDDLERARLIERGGFNVMMSGPGLVQKRTTAFGDTFLRFISRPDALG